MLRIDKENQALLQKMLEIQHLSSRNQNHPNLPHSLNGPSRKMNAENIDRENFLFAKRLAKP